MEIHGKFGKFEFDYEGAAKRNFDAYKLKFKLG